MTRPTTKKSLLLATVISSLCFGSAAMAGYDINSIGESLTRDLENGVVVKSVRNTDFTVNIVLVDGTNETLIAENSSGSEHLNLSNGIVYWISSQIVDGNLERTLNAAQYGTTTVIHTSANRIGGFSYDDEGNVAWVEHINGGNEVFYYDGTSITQITTGHTNFAISDDTRNIHTQNGNVVWGESQALYLWNGYSVEKISPEGQSLGQFASLDANTVTWIASDAITSASEVFQYDFFQDQEGVLTQLTNDGEPKNDVLTKDGITTYQVSNGHIGIPSDDLYVIENGNPELLSIRSVSVDIDNGKVVWTEGQSLDINGELFQYENGLTTQIDTNGMRANSMMAEGGHILWVNSGSETWLASPAAEQETPVINLGGEHGVTEIDLSEATTIQVSQWSPWSWTPSNIGFGFSPADNMTLNGIVAIDSDGNSHNLADYWAAVNRPFSWEPIRLTLPAVPGRVINVQWWAEG